MVSISFRLVAPVMTPGGICGMADLPQAEVETPEDPQTREETAVGPAGEGRWPDDLRPLPTKGRGHVS